MSTNGPVDLEALRKQFRHWLRDHADGDTFALAGAQLRLLVDALGRLQQSNDRLRRQNRRVRLKLQRAGLADDEAPESDGGEV